MHVLQVVIVAFPPILLLVVGVVSLLLVVGVVSPTLPFLFLVSFLILLVFFLVLLAVLVRPSFDHKIYV